MQISGFKHLGRVQPLKGYRWYFWLAEVTVTENGEQVRREVVSEHDREVGSERSEWYFADTGYFCPPEVEELHKRWCAELRRADHIEEIDRAHRVEDAKMARKLLTT